MLFYVLAHDYFYNRQLRYYQVAGQTSGLQTAQARQPTHSAGNRTSDLIRTSDGGLSRGIRTNQLHLCVTDPFDTIRRA